MGFLSQSSLAISVSNGIQCSRTISSLEDSPCCCNFQRMIRLFLAVGTGVVVLGRARPIICNRLFLTDIDTDCQNIKLIPIRIILST